MILSIIAVIFSIQLIIGIILGKLYSLYTLQESDGADQIILRKIIKIR